VRPLPNEVFLARTKKNVAQDRSVLLVHEDLSNGSDEVDCEKKPLCTNCSKSAFAMAHFYSNIKLIIALMNALSKQVMYMQRSQGAWTAGLIMGF
jgi:hypothetical protein